VSLKSRIMSLFGILANHTVFDQMIERICAAALDEPDRHAALRFLSNALLDPPEATAPRSAAPYSWPDGTVSRALGPARENIRALTFLKAYIVSGCWELKRKFRFTGPASSHC